jgi:hypothetical protein
VKLSNSTAATLIDVVSGAYSHSELDTLFLRLDCANVGPTRDLSSTAPGPNKMDRVRPVVDRLRNRDDQPDVISLLRELIEVKFDGRVFDYQGNVVQFLERLVREFELDGYTVSEDGRVVATTPDPAALGPEISRLERELDERGLGVARAHYRQAVDSFVDGRLEASNGQLRSFIEDFMLTLCAQITGTRAADARGAAERIRSHGGIDGDETKLITGLAGLSNQRGAHAGLTDRDEALFRLHMTTAVARYLLARLP